MSRITHAKHARRFQKTADGIGYMRRAKVLPARPQHATYSKKGLHKKHVLESAKEKIASMGGTFLRYNRKSRVCHYLSKTGNKVAKSVYLG